MDSYWYTYMGAVSLRAKLLLLWRGGGLQKEATWNLNTRNKQRRVNEKKLGILYSIILQCNRGIMLHIISLGAPVTVKKHAFGNTPCRSCSVIHHFSVEIQVIQAREITTPQYIVSGIIVTTSKEGYCLIFGLCPHRVVPVQMPLIRLGIKLLPQYRALHQLSRALYIPHIPLSCSVNTSRET